jgi:GDPmannose 4,6-dehydratase
VRDFVNAAANELGISLRWEGDGVDEIGIVDAIGDESPISIGAVVVRVDPRYFRPAEVESLLGDPTKAKQKLGWEAKTEFKELVAEMVRADLEIARRDELVKKSGFRVFDYNE